jgi:hypothetical protein
MTPLKVERGKGNIFFGLQVLAGLMDVFNFGDKWQQKSETYTVSPHLASNSSTSLTDFLGQAAVQLDSPTSCLRNIQYHTFPA